VLPKIVYLLTCRVLGVAVPVFRCEGGKEAELRVLRHENAVLRRHVGPVRYEPLIGCGWLRWPGWSPPRRRAEILPVTPATLLAWHRKLAAMKYDPTPTTRP
jgi:putative transposase